IARCAFVIGDCSRGASCPSWPSHPFWPFTPRSALRAADDSEIRAPRPDFARILSGQHARDLRHMIEVVRDPRCEQLPKRDDAELGMTAAAIEIGIGQAERRQLSQILLPE